MPLMAMSGAGIMHGDSEMGELWQALYRDDRTPNSTLNKIMDVGVASHSGRMDFDEALTQLRKLQADAPDSTVANRIQRTIDAIDAPKREVPDLPDSVPAVVKEALRKLADIPTARKAGRVGSRNLDESILDKKVDIVRQIDSGELSPFDVRSKLGAHDLHESTDGATQMWKIFDQLSGDKEVDAWARSARKRATAGESSAPPAPKKATNVAQLPTARKETSAPSRPATVTQLPVAKGGKLPPGLQEVVSQLRSAQNEQQAREALSGLLGVELKKILSNLGLSTEGSKDQLIQRLISFAVK